MTPVRLISPCLPLLIAALFAIPGQAVALLATSTLSGATAPVDPVRYLRLEVRAGCVR